MNLIMVTGYTDGYGGDKGWAERFALGKYNYCIKHGYNFLLKRRGFDDTRPPAWSKIAFVQQVLGCHDWVWWIDADAEIKNPEVRLESYITQARAKDCIITEDACGLNSGVFALRNCAWSKFIIDEIWSATKYLNHPWWENRAVHEILPRYPERLCVLPQKGLNSYPECYSDGDHILHFAGSTKDQIVL